MMFAGLINMVLFYRMSLFLNRLCWLSLCFSFLCVDLVLEDEAFYLPCLKVIKWIQILPVAHDNYLKRRGNKIALDWSVYLFLGLSLAPTLGGKKRATSYLYEDLCNVFYCF